IFRLPDNGATPGDFMSSAWGIMQRLYHRSGPKVVVTRSRYLAVMFESLKKLNSNRLQELYVTTSMDDAVDIVQTIDC
ncbi:MAG TPA: hypothetical protein VHL11_11675, partial [Phototrophicaceae bacterium]|nr:hypothetical protein [Phototrophicaceae bacterium]